MASFIRKSRIRSVRFCRYKPIYQNMVINKVYYILRIVAISCVHVFKRTIKKFAISLVSLGRYSIIIIISDFPDLNNFYYLT